MVKLKDLGINEEPVAPTIAPLPPSKTGDLFPENIDEPGVREQVSSLATLRKDPDTTRLRQAEKEAAALYPQMRRNYLVLIEYGKPAVKRLNNIITQMEEEVEEVHIPELVNYITKLSSETLGFKEEFNVADEKVEQEVDEEINATGWRKFLHRGQTFLERMDLKYASLKRKIDLVTAHQTEETRLLFENIDRDSNLYIANEEEVLEMVYVIAVMELVKELAQADLKKIGTGDRNKAEESEELAGFIHNLDTKISEYRTRMLLGWTNSPQIRARRDANVGLVMKLDNQIELIVPLIRKAKVEWTSMVKAKQAAKASRPLADTANALLTAVAETGAKIVPQIVEEAHKPTVTAETLDKVSEFVRAQAEGVLAALESTQLEKNSVNESIARSRRLMLETSDLMADSAIDEVLKDATSRLKSEKSK